MQQQQQFETTVRTAQADTQSTLSAAQQRLVDEMHAQGWQISGKPFPYAAGLAVTITFIRPFGGSR